MSSTKQISLEEVAKHSSESDCWIVIKGKVYDVSNFHEQHPGKRAVYLAAGADGTSLMENIHRGAGHSSEAIEWMEKFLIGVIAPE